MAPGLRLSTLLGHPHQHLRNVTGLRSRNNRTRNTRVGRTLVFLFPAAAPLPQIHSGLAHLFTHFYLKNERRNGVYHCSRT